MARLGEYALQCKHGLHQACKGFDNPCMTQDRSEGADTQSGKDWDPKNWRPSESFNSSGFSPDSGYSHSFGDSAGHRNPPIQRPARWRGVLVLIVAIVLVILAGAAGVMKLVHLLRG